MNENLARDASDFAASAILFSGCIMLGYFSPLSNIDHFDKFIDFLVIYSTIGSIIMNIKDIYPPSTEKLKSGSVDIRFGMKVQYWSLWWPMYLAYGKK